MLQGMLSGIAIGWIWGIMWACDVKKWNLERHEFIAGGGQTNTAPLMGGQEMAPAAAME